MAEKKFQDKLESWGDKIVNSIKYDRLKLWKEVFFHPTDVLTAEQKNASLGRAAKDVFIASVPSLILGFAAILLFLAYMGFMSMGIAVMFMEYAATIGIIGMILILLSLILYLLSPIISWLVSSLIQFVVAKILGGKAKFATHAYLTGVSTASVRAATIPFLLISMIPCIGQVAAPVATLIGFYLYYLEYKSIKIAHKVDDLRAIIATIADILVWTTIILLLVVSFYIGMISLVVLSKSAS